MLYLFQKHLERISELFFCTTERESANAERRIFGKVSTTYFQKPPFALCVFPLFRIISVLKFRPGGRNLACWTVGRGAHRTVGLPEPKGVRVILTPVHRTVVFPGERPQIVSNANIQHNKHNITMTDLHDSALNSAGFCCVLL